MSIVVIFLSKMVVIKKGKGSDLAAKPPLGDAMGMGLVHRRVPPRPLAVRNWYLFIKSWMKRDK